MPAGENSIIEFLTRNPDFLIRHPDLLRRISVPHGFQGKTVSLLEYQARLLRERLQGLEQQYRSESLKTNAHRLLSKNLKLLVPALYESNEPEKMLGMLEDFLVRHYAATCIRIYAAALPKNHPAKPKHLLRPLDPWRRGLFTLILNNTKPLCDSLQQEHLVALFGEPADAIHSSLLIPFRYRGEEALIAVGSTEWQKYKQSVELDILITVLEVLSRLTEPSKMGEEA